MKYSITIQISYKKYHSQWLLKFAIKKYNTIIVIIFFEYLHKYKSKIITKSHIHTYDFKQFILKLISEHTINEYILSTHL